LQSDEQLRNAPIKVSADVEKNAVTLSGTVASEEARNRALELAKSAHSGITVNDQIEVKPVA
jgi:osmotically-inducible protein OsmY